MNLPLAPALNRRPPRVLLAAVGDANDERTWSGIPHHILMRYHVRNSLVVKDERFIQRVMVGVYLDMV